MKEKIPTQLNIPDYSWELNTPGFLKEACENSRGGIYTVCWNIFKKLLVMVAARAAELDDPVMNVLMLKLNLYSNPKDGTPLENSVRRKLIKQYTNEIQHL